MTAEAALPRPGKIILRPRLQLAAGADPDRAVRVMEKAEQACLISASLATPIRFEPELR
jgi:organic hydroperoxide reductase OsmC/OhrA